MMKDLKLYEKWRKQEGKERKKRSDMSSVDQGSSEEYIPSEIPLGREVRDLIVG